MGSERRREEAQVLHPARAAERFRLGRVEAPPELAPLLDYLWWVEWDTPEPYVQEIAPRPVVHLSAEWWGGEARLLVHGVPTQLSEHKLSGVGRTVAAAFRPGGFRPFLTRPGAAACDVAELTDRIVPAADLLGADDRAVAEQLLHPDLAPEGGAAHLADWLAHLGAPTDPVAEDVAALVELAEADGSVRRADQLAERASVSLRTLERRFRRYVGVSPKWVVQRHRLLDVLREAHQGREPDWAHLAATLGYADQSHLIRRFAALVGEPPARYLGGVGEVRPRPA